MQLRSNILGLVAGAAVTMLAAGAAWAQRPVGLPNEPVVEDTLPESVRAVRDNFTRTSPGETALIGVLLAAAGGWLAWRSWVHLRRDRAAQPGPDDDPQALFEELLGALELTAEERKLLRRVVKGARLRHPAMALLSPGLLAWSMKLWRAEKGPRMVNEAVGAQLEQVSDKLFGEPLPRAETAAVVPTDKDNTPATAEPVKLVDEAEALVSL